MFEFRKSQHLDNTSDRLNLKAHDNRTTSCRRLSFDTKYLGMGKCIDKRKNDRRKDDRFDSVEYERICSERLGPGWL